MAEPVVIIGGGLAGLSCACDLVDAGVSVTVLERRPFAGGKTYSFTDRETGATVDNGQHVYLGCCTEYVSFLRRLGTYDLAPLQHRFTLSVLDPAGRRATLRDGGLPAPLTFLPSLLGYRHLALAGRLRAIRALLAIKQIGAAGRGQYDEETFAAWLRRHGQRDPAITRLWDLLIIAALNAPSNRVSAAAAMQVFQDALLAAPHNAAIGVPRAGLSALHVDPAVRYIEARGGRVLTRRTVSRIVPAGENRHTVVLSDGETLAAPSVVLAVPPAAVPDLLPAEWLAGALAHCRDFEAAPIVNLHFWFDRPVMTEAFTAFVESPVQWIFNRSLLSPEPGLASGQYITVSISAAWDSAGLTKQALQARFQPELSCLLPAAREARTTRFVAVKEPDATFVPKPGLARLRPPQRTGIPGLYAAGAWTATGWPATMESAVRSGRLAAAALLADLRPEQAHATAQAG